MLRVNALSYKHILKEISFTVKKGEIVAILGPNGAGKTTLFRCLMRLLKPSKGSVYLKEKRLSAYQPKELARVAAYCPQSPKVGFDYLVRTVVLMGRSPYLSPLNAPSAKDFAVVEKAMEILGIKALAERPLHTLSGGQQRLVFLARALAQEAELIFLDEPTAHLDLKHQIHVLQKIKDLAREKGLTFVMNLHDPNMALAYAGRILLLKAGRLIGELSAKDEKLKQALEELYEIEFSLCSLENKLFVFPRI
ncbi:ABC transporter ATP-binding protein [Thermodesulfatator atlanticus]|uniref:ABC transporter ATP-binding protein n=1 Tax=Thermodesulfatator atlanticus TaxID=501497 RepID=UPI0003B6D422|nr:ABC transporter ATP-binding protein [Thermodesulfatator atlanticus]